MGAGKSAVGRELSRRLGWPRRDTDEIIRQRLGQTIPEIFLEQGEEAFRQTETETLRELSTGEPFVLVTGGGIVLRDENIALLRGLGWRCWLDGDEEELWQRASRRQNRPLLQAEDPRARFAELFRERAARYASAMEYRLDTTGKSIAAVAEEILGQL